MDFGALPPEVTSARMYAGPGAGSLLLAAAAWEAVADELYCAANSCAATIAAVTGQTWIGQAAVAMATAMGPYLAWLTATADLARQSAVQARAAASAFETARAAVVPLPVIAANRALLMLLSATNVLGVNTPAIAAVEAEYGEMWAQDAAAMYGYAGAAAAASTLTGFAPPPEMTNPAGLADQAAAAGKAVNAATLSAVSTVPLALQQLAQPVAASNSGWTFAECLSLLSSLTSPASAAASTMSSTMSAMSSVSSVAKLLGSSTTVVASEAATLGSALSGVGAAAPAAGLFTAGIPSAIAAEVGKAASLGPLSVPPSWASAAMTASPAAAPFSGAAAVPVAQSAGSGNLLGGLPVAGMPGRGGGSGLNSATSRAGAAPTVMPRPLFGG
ncbi:PPE family protein [Mycobacterium persicum]|uniref:PPE family protein n=1 Tax=Mycobacterium persicum TaxID=1487726 RepID=UPI0015943918|nr:PPE family protein [Mycobacterium persicum]